LLEASIFLWTAQRKIFACGWTSFRHKSLCVLLTKLVYLNCSYWNTASRLELFFKKTKFVFFRNKSSLVIVVVSDLQNRNSCSIFPGGCVHRHAHWLSSHHTSFSRTSLSNVLVCEDISLDFRGLWRPTLCGMAAHLVNPLAPEFFFKY
jgi:hypothetical protein